MDNMGFLPDPGDDYLLLFITNEQRNTLIMEAEWPKTIECIPDGLFYKIPKLDPRSKDMHARFGNTASYKKLIDRQYRIDRAYAKAIGKKFVNPENRVYLYISEPSEAKEHSCHYDTSRMQYYISDTHPHTEKLIKKFTTKKAKKLWHNNLSQLQKRVDRKETAMQAPIYTEFDCDAEIIRPKGRKQGSSLNAQLVVKMLGIRIAKNIIPKNTPLSKAAKIICVDLRMMSETYIPDGPLKQGTIIPVGANVTPSMVNKCLAPTPEERTRIQRMLRNSLNLHSQQL